MSEPLPKPKKTTAVRSHDEPASDDVAANIGASCRAPSPGAADSELDDGAMCDPDGSVAVDDATTCTAPVPARCLVTGPTDATD